MKKFLVVSAIALAVSGASSAYAEEAKMKSKRACLNDTTCYVCYENGDLKVGNKQAVEGKKRADIVNQVLVKANDDACKKHWADKLAKKQAKQEKK